MREEEQTDGWKRHQNDVSILFIYLSFFKVYKFCMHNVSSMPPRGRTSRLPGELLHIFSTHLFSVTT